MSDHLSIIKYLVKKPIDYLLLLYHLPTELYYFGILYNINDVRKEMITYDSKQMEVVRLYIGVHDSEMFKQVGWVLNDSVSHCMCCHCSFKNFERKHHCRVCGNIICHKITCMTKSNYINDMVKHGFQIMCKKCKPSSVSGSLCLRCRSCNML